MPAGPFTPGGPSTPAGPSTPVGLSVPAGPYASASPVVGPVAPVIQDMTKSFFIGKAVTAIDHTSANCIQKVLSGLAASFSII